LPSIFQIAGGKPCPAALIGAVTQFKDLMDKEGQQVKDKKVHRQILLSVPIVVLDSVFKQ
jgi:hypothetical protein